MSQLPASRDLVVLVADRDMEAAVSGLLSRPEAANIRPISFQVYPHPSHDPGCRTDAIPFLRPFCRQFSHALVLFDREGSGKDDVAAEALELQLEEQLARNGWSDRAAVVVIAPELEAWVWSKSPQVDQVLGWQGRIPALRQWLVEEGFLSSPESKPDQPKEAFRQALRIVKRQPSSALFKQLASCVSIRNCQDRAFQKLLDRLVNWFPASH